MHLRFLRIENMHNLDAARFQKIRDKPTMTAPPNRFRAHDCRRTFALRDFEKPIDPFAKVAGLHVIGVTAERVIAPGGVMRIRRRKTPAAELGKMFVIDFAGMERVSQLLFVELRVALRPGEQPHIGDEFDSVCLERADEF